MDVTAEILQNHLIYGASDNTAPAGLSSSRSLNYANGPSITRPDNIKIRLLPYTLKYQDSVGLFGAENYFVKVTVDLDPEFAAKCYEEKDWECAIVTSISNKDYYYDEVLFDEYKDLVVENTYHPVNLNMSLTTVANSYIEVNLNNLKTGNIYVDNWLDTRLYTADREEHPYDKLYIRENDVFYIGIHARNTRRLPYNVECLIGKSYIAYEDMTDEQRRYIARRIN